MKTFNKFIEEANSVCNNTGKGTNCPVHGIMICPGLKKKYTPNTPHPGNIPEENLHKWFQSKAKDGTRGWVNVVTGGTCASDEPGEGVPKCVSSEKRASMTPEERRSAARRKKAADPNQQEKTGAAKPTYVKTDVKEAAGEKDACYKKVKSRYRVWPSAYASGALVKCRKVGAKNWGTKKENMDYSDTDDLDNKMGVASHEKHIRYEKRYCAKCKKEEHRHECVYGPKMWDAYSVPVDLKDMHTSHLHLEAYTRIQERGTTYSIMSNWRGKIITSQMFFPQFTRPTKGEVVREIRKIYPGAVVIYFNPATNDPTKPLLFAGVNNGPTKNRT